MIRYKKYFFILLVLVFGLFLTSCDGLAEFKFDNNYLTVEVGKTIKSTTISNETKEINFFSGDESIAQVDGSGNVTGITKGETIIYAVFKNEPYKCFVNVIGSTDNVEVYQRDAVLTANMENADIKAAIPLKATYNGHNNLVELEDNMKIQFIADFTKVNDNNCPAGSKGLQVKNNIMFVYMITTFLELTNTDMGLKPFVDVFKEYYDTLSPLTGDELESKVNELTPLTGYVYLNNNYLGIALFKGNNLAAYKYSNENIGIIPKIKSAVLLFNQLISRGINLQKIDYIEITKDYSGDLITEETANNLKKYQSLVSTLVYLALGELRVNKQKIENDDNKVRVSVDITENGIKKINEIDAKFAVINSLNTVIDLYRDNNTNYTHLRKISLNIGTLLGPLNINLNGDDIVKASGDNLFPYEKNHSTYEESLKKTN
ncbi:MAG: Ig-like domain-containing protein [Acholeplasmatales bacterium]|nr:Ig-like domain-containing protein [Acholeplasmatales bacterium]